MTENYEYTTVWVIEATPPKSGIFSDLKPRFQMWNCGAICIYYTEDSANAYVHICRSEKTGWSYRSVMKMIDNNDLKDISKYK